MRSVPPRGSGWVLGAAACVWAKRTHLLPHGGTDLMGPRLECVLRRPTAIPTSRGTDLMGPLVALRLRDQDSGLVASRELLIAVHLP